MLDVLKAGVDRLEGILRNVGPDQYGDQTPCTEFDVQGLLGHIVGGQYFMRSMLSGQPMEQPPAGFLGDPAGAYRAAADKHLAEWSAPDVFDRKVDFPGVGEIGTPSAMGIFIMEAFTHGWDLAKATGQDPTIPAEVANVLLEAFKRQPIPDSMRKGDTPQFGPEILVADDASPSDKLVAYLGRQP